MWFVMPASLFHVEIEVPGTQAERKARIVPRPPAHRAAVPLCGCEGFLTDFGLGFFGVFLGISVLPMFIDHQEEAHPPNELKT